VWQRTFDRPAQSLAVAVVGMCVLSLAVIAAMTGHDLARLSTIRERVLHTERIQLLAYRIERSVRASKGSRAAIDPTLLRELTDEADQLRAADLALDANTNRRLEDLHELLERAPETNTSDLATVVDLVGEIVDAETSAQEALWKTIDADTRIELGMVVGLCVILPVLAVFTVGFVRRRIFAPLNELRGALSMLAEGDHRPWQAKDAHSALEPLFSNYNRLVSRLEELEQEHQSHARTLESEVRVATQALLEQQRTLARAEKLAAIGETTACLAHELRNPLAGILMSLGNLRRDVANADLVARLDLVVAELERLTRMLNEALAAARHTPEPARPVNLRELVTDLLALLRHQVPDAVALECGIPFGIQCALPPDRIRQALLNLILNSVRALGNGPGRVEITAERRDGTLEIEVIDDGSGFPPEMLRTGIRPFSSNLQGGTGLGLAMVRRVAVDLGGEVALANREPHGACVRLTVECIDD
jgi:two-component system NtrC family sensor kinase